MVITRGLEPKGAMGTGAAAINTVINTALIKMHDTFNKRGKITNIKEYDLTNGYIRKLLGSQVIVPLTGNKKRMAYGWNGGDNPDYNELVQKVIDFKTTRKTSVEVDTKIIFELSFLLNDYGVQRSKIPDLIKEIQRIYQK